MKTGWIKMKRLLQADIDINGDFTYYDGERVTTLRVGSAKVPTTEVFLNVEKAMRKIKLLNEAIDDMSILLDNKLDDLEDDDAGVWQ